MLLYQGYGSNPTIHSPLIVIPTVHPTIRSCSPKVYSRMPAAVQAFQLSPFLSSQGLPFSLNYRSGQRYSCTPVVNRLHRVLKHAHSLLFVRTYRLQTLVTFLFLPHPYAQCLSSRKHMQTRIGLHISQRLSHAGTRSSEASLAKRTRKVGMPRPTH